MKLLYNVTGDNMKQHCTRCMYADLPREYKTFKANQTIFLEGDTLQHIFLIDDGLIKISKLFLNGEERIFEILGPNEFVALVSVLKGDLDYVATATCLTDTTVGIIKREDVMNAYRNSSEFKDVCMSCLVDRTNLFQSQLYQTSNVDTEDKIMSVFNYLLDKFGLEKDDKQVLDLPFNKTVLANIIGIRRETLSRKLTKMQKDNIIEVSKNKYIFNRL